MKFHQYAFYVSTGGLMFCSVRCFLRAQWGTQERPHQIEDNLFLISVLMRLTTQGACLDLGQRLIYLFI
jgi:hypothetical protein